ncbi:hypothetical protein [Streptomyces sp. NPDC059874]|uniref:hypothetical protein n=1 Tax=Streptomyces sp. NPDC059874 TaxID=3346983 RepID=UPI00366671BF
MAVQGVEGKSNDLCMGELGDGRWREPGRLLSVTPLYSPDHETAESGIMSITTKNKIATRAGLTASVATALLLAGVGAAGAAPVPIDPVERYELYLSEKVAAGVPEAAEVMNGFKALSDEKKEDFVGYINDPEVNKAFVEALSGAGGPSDTPVNEENFVTETRKVLHGGDVVIESEHSTGTAAPAAPAKAGFSALGWAGDHSEWHSVSDTVLGIRVTTVTIGVNYRTSAWRTLEVYSGWAGQSNFVPGVTFSNSPVQKWISVDPGNNAHAETVWKGKIAGTYSWSARHRVWADQDGYQGGYLKRI